MRESLQVEFQELFDQMVQDEHAAIGSVSELQLSAIAESVAEHLCDQLVSVLIEMKEQILNVALDK